MREWWKICDWGQNNIQRINVVTGQYLGAIAPEGGLDHPYFVCFLPRHLVIPSSGIAS